MLDSANTFRTKSALRTEFWSSITDESWRKANIWNCCAGKVRTPGFIPSSSEGTPPTSRSDARQARVWIPDHINCPMAVVGCAMFARRGNPSGFAAKGVGSIVLLGGSVAPKYPALFSGRLQRRVGQPGESRNSFDAFFRAASARHCRKTIQKVVYCVARRRALLPGRDGLVARRSAPTAG